MIDIRDDMCFIPSIGGPKKTEMLRGMTSLSFRGAERWQSHQPTGGEKYSWLIIEVTDMI